MTAFARLCENSCEHEAHSLLVYVTVGSYTDSYCNVFSFTNTSMPEQQATS